jgi:uncharacterized repeat protein (TIGR01451 family)
LRVEIDLDNDSQSFYYGGQLLYSGSWTDEVSGGGSLNIDTIDLFANGASPVYYDDIGLSGPPPAVCGLPEDIAWLSTTPSAGSTLSGTTSVVDVSFDSTGLATGVYTGTLCVNSNDPDSPLLTVPLTLTVEPPPPPVPALELLKTVGTNPSECASSDTITVTLGTEVTYCFSVSNTGNITLTVHDLLDDQLGLLLDDLAYDLAPGASTFITATAVITEQTSNTATWTGWTADSAQATDSDSATVFVLPPPQEGFTLYLPVIFRPDSGG